jgi:hypothetical protein
LLLHHADCRFWGADSTNSKPIGEHGDEAQRREKIVREFVITRGNASLLRWYAECAFCGLIAGIIVLIPCSLRKEQNASVSRPLVARQPGIRGDKLTQVSATTQSSLFRGGSMHIYFSDRLWQRVSPAPCCFTPPLAQRWALTCCQVAQAYREAARWLALIGKGAAEIK